MTLAIVASVVGFAPLVTALAVTFRIATRPADTTDQTK